MKIMKMMMIIMIMIMIMIITKMMEDIGYEENDDDISQEDDDDDDIGHEDDDDDNDYEEDNEEDADFGRDDKRKKCAAAIVRWIIVTDKRSRGVLLFVMMM